MDEKEKYMKIALDLALKGRGSVSPNPVVGAVVVKDGRIVGKGWHREFGSPHAEVEAINDAGLDDFTGCDMYVTLEPCVHHGKTPPCAPLIIEKKFSRVIIGMIDPNPAVSGKGVAALQEAGVEVETGVLEKRCRRVNRFFVKHMETGLPYLILKIAQSLDGCIATATGQSKWISCDESRRRSHLLRSEVDAVLIGKNTAKSDNPQLTVRSVQGRNPKKIALDSNLTLPLSLNIFTNDDREKTIVCSGRDAAASRKADNLRVSGVKVLSSELDENGKIKLDACLKNLLDTYNIQSILVEGGAGVYSAMLAAKLVDELHVFVAPKILGAGLGSFSSLNIDYMNQAINLKTLAVSKSGDDVHFVYLPAERA